MKANQLAAIKKLQAALLSCKRANLAMCGVEDSLFIVALDDEFEEESRDRSACEVMLHRHNTGGDVEAVKHYGVYLDSGGS